MLNIKSKTYQCLQNVLLRKYLFTRCIHVRPLYNKHRKWNSFQLHQLNRIILTDIDCTKLKCMHAFHIRICLIFEFLFDVTHNQTKDDDFLLLNLNFTINKTTRNGTLYYLLFFSYLQIIKSVPNNLKWIFNSCPIIIFVKGQKGSFDSNYRFAWVSFTMGQATYIVEISSCHFAEWNQLIKGDEYTHMLFYNKLSKNVRPSEVGSSPCLSQKPFY